MPTKVQDCPACGGVHFNSTGPEVAGFGVKCSDREFQQPPYAVRECATCGLLYKNNTASPAELDEYYARVDFRKWEIPGHFPTERAALAILRTMPKDSRFLDFGCSSGRLLAPLVGDYQCSGYEMNEPAAATAAAKGIKMLPSNALEPPLEPFDAIVMLDVFEHLAAPAELLRKLWRLVKPNAAVLIVTGNGDVPACRLDPAQFWYFRTLEHLCMLTRRHADFLAGELGARLVLWQEVSHYDTPLGCRLKQHAQHFAFWQFRHGTLLATTILPLLPMLNRARHWPVAPGFTCTRDHVLALFRKPPCA